MAPDMADGGTAFPEAAGLAISAMKRRTAKTFAVRKSYPSCTFRFTVLPTAKARATNSPIL